jgi:hypothetical protein
MPPSALGFDRALPLNRSAVALLRETHDETRFMKTAFSRRPPGIRGGLRRSRSKPSLPRPKSALTGNARERSLKDEKARSWRNLWHDFRPGLHAAACPLRVLRYPTKPRPAKPTTSIAHVEGSGATVAEIGPAEAVAAVGVSRKEKVPLVDPF